MRLNFCAACGDLDTTRHHLHHLVPKTCGGSDDETNLLTLCNTCHGRIHGRADFSHPALIRTGQLRAKNNGVKFGPQRKINERQVRNLSLRYTAGASLNQLSATFGIPRETIREALIRACVPLRGRAPKFHGVVS